MTRLSVLRRKIHLRRPRLQNVLLSTHLIIVLLPLAGISVLRIYESALIRQTESELIAQSAFVSAAYKDALLKQLQQQHLAVDRYGRQVAEPFRPDDEQIWQPQPVGLDLARDPVYKRAGDALPATTEIVPAAVLAGETMQNILHDAQSITLAGLRIVDVNGVVVASTGSEKGMSLVQRREIKQALTGSRVSMMRKRVSDSKPPPFASMSRGANLRVFVAMPVMVHEWVVGAVLASRTPRNILEALYGKRHLLLLSSVVLILMVLVLTLFTSYTIKRPIRALMHQAERAVRGEKGAVVTLRHPVTVEIDQLSQAVAEMAEVLEDRADYLRHFSSHVSHALKTPLTSIQGAAELLLDHGETMSVSEKQKFLQNIIADTHGLQELVHRLLELARAQVIKTADKACDLVPLIDQVVERYWEMGLHVHWHGGRSCRVKIDPPVYQSMLASLLDNAAMHAGDLVEVDLRMNRSSDDTAVDLVVSDNGPGVSDANAKKLFEPFFTTARHRGGTGLGLAVVKKLAMAHGGDLRHRSAGDGAVFHLTLPLSKPM